MFELIEANWPLILVALLIGLAVAWLIFVASRKAHVETTKGDVLDEGAPAAARNQALIDSGIDSGRVADTAPIPPTTPPGLAGLGAAVTAAAVAAPVERTSATAVPSDDAADDLTRMKGVGPKLSVTLAELGVTRFDQIAAWDDAAIDRIDAQLGRFQGRIRRDSWVRQADFLARDDMAGFESAYGKMS